MSKTYGFPDGDVTAPVGAPEVNFPTVFRDLAGMKSDGLLLSTPSNEATKLYDALLHQIVYHYNDAQLGGFMDVSKKMMEADPDFAMGQILLYGIDCFASNPSKNEEPRKKLIDFSAKAKSMNLTKFEREHLVAAKCMASEDLYGAMMQFKHILTEYPLDPYALQMGYFIALTTGHTQMLRDIPQSVVKQYKPTTSFYPNVYGKLCFGQSENGDFLNSEISGRLALDIFPLDNWSHHALAHNFEESGRPLQGRRFLANTQGDWTRGTTFSHHIWWHSALFHVQLGEYDAALAVYDDKVGPMDIADGGNFPLSDASSLLMRLQLEGVDTGDRIKNQLAGWEKHLDDHVSLFYDGHIAFASLLGGDRTLYDKLHDSMSEFVKGERSGWNKDVTTNVGIPLIEGIRQYMDGDFNGAVESLAPVMPEVQKRIQGSWAQKDIFQQILLHAAVKSADPKNLQLAQDIINNKMKRNNMESHSPLNQRFMEKIMSVHSTQG